MAQSLEGKVALVTGGGSGIGRATCLAFARNGAQVVVADVVEGGGNETVDIIKQEGGEATFIKADVTREDDVKNLVAKTVETYGGLDYAFNNAGVEGEQAPLHELPTEEWLRVMDINANGVFYCLKHELTYMVEHGGGAIVNTSSIAGLMGTATSAQYSASKHAVVGLTKSAALGYATAGIRVNSIHPGAINTPMIARVMEVPEVAELIEGLHPMGRVGEPEEVADTVVWLCSDEASFITGHTMVIDGGNRAQ